jgi:predicted TIM-barrel fold metal-dependent hydrolase
MDQVGVQKAAIVQASTCYGHDNSYVADAVVANPKRLTGVFSVDVLAPDAGERMRFWFGKKLTGLRLFTFGSTMSEQANWLDDPKSYPAWACAGELGLSICLQMSAKAIPQAASMAERFPKVRIILDHCARPVLEDGPPYSAAVSLFRLARHPNIYLKLTPRIFAEARRGKAAPETFFPRLVAEFGASRLAWGSNYPSSDGTLPALLKTARESLACLAKADQEWIFAKTAQVLYPALAD